MLIRWSSLRVALLFVVAAVSANAQNPRWQEMRSQKIFSFSLDCAEKASFPKHALNETVQSSIPASERGKQQTYGDLAVSLKLNSKGPVVHFVPILCEAQCTWLLYTINPLKKLGEIKGDSLSTYQSLEGMPLIVTTSAVDAFTSNLSTYAYDSKEARYVSMGDKYTVTSDGKNLNWGQVPTFLRKPKALIPQCKNQIQ